MTLAVAAVLFGALAVRAALRDLQVIVDGTVIAFDAAGDRSVADVARRADDFCDRAGIPIEQKCPSRIFVEAANRMRGAATDPPRGAPGGYQ